MPEFNEKIKSSGQRLSFVMLRRGRKVLLRVPVKSLVAGIRNGKILPTDEFSPDGEHWMPVGRNRQLSRYFMATGGPQASAPAQNPRAAGGNIADDENKLEENLPPPPHIEKQLSELAEMFREFNG
ncbi:MAG: hypothetical protein E2O41_00485 [Nitrospina sp.]|nr:MAG: hypothetical protein E2O41_00485 [Nitrospina sp.]